MGQKVWAKFTLSNQIIGLLSHLISENFQKPSVIGMERFVV